MAPPSRFGKHRSPVPAAQGGPWPQLVTMLVSIAGALLVSAVVFIGANRAVDSVRSRWPAFTASLGVLAGLLVGAVVQHNGWLPRGPAVGGPLKEGWLLIGAGRDSGSGRRGP